MATDAAVDDTERKPERESVMAWDIDTDERDYQRRCWETVSEEVMWEEASDSSVCSYHWHIRLRRHVEQNGLGEERVRYRGSVTRDTSLDGEDWMITTTGGDKAAEVVAGIADIMWRLAPEQHCPMAWERARRETVEEREQLEKAQAAYEDALSSEVWHAQNLVQLVGQQELQQGGAGNEQKH